MPATEEAPMEIVAPKFAKLETEEVEIPEEIPAFQARTYPRFDKTK